MKEESLHTKMLKNYNFAKLTDNLICLLLKYTASATKRFNYLTKMHLKAMLEILQVLFEIEQRQA